MLKGAKSTWIISFIFFCVQIVQICAIYQSCSTGSNCPANSFCGFRNYCICNNGYILNCSTTAQNISANSFNGSITSGYSYFVIQPQTPYEYLKFTIKLSTSQSQNQSLIVTLWGQTGYLTELTTNNQMSTIELPISQADVQTIVTTYFLFGLQPNGQSQVLYVGIKLNSTNTTTYQLGVSVEQQLAYSQDTFRIILTVLMGILSVACFVLMAFCIYRRRRMNSMRERAEQQKEVKSTSHFDQYMPKVTADRVRVPLQVCSVCLNDITMDNEVRLTICKHLFHGDCIDSWCKKNTSCPICRQELDLQSCQKILGEEFDLSEVTQRKATNQTPNGEVEMIERKINRNEPSHLNEEEIMGENSMRRGML